ncbi:MAG: AsmA family protein [Candidatus Omnitrophica bacterium]|nr:AsmA family protein [Candidatus Omnitrophota bacterium]
MRKVFIALISLVLLATIGVFVFALTFDANKYKGALVKKIEAAIDKDVRIGSISLNVIPELAFRLNGLAIKDKDKGWDNVILSAGSIEANVKLMPLLKKDIEIESLRLRGLEIVVDKNSLVTLPSQAKESQPVTTNTGAAAVGALKFLAKSISVEDSSIRYLDRDSRLPMDFRVDIVEALVRNVSLYGPAGIEARLSAFGNGAENIKITATIYPEVNLGKPYIKNLALTVNLDKLDLKDALGVFGQGDVAHQYIGDNMAGKLTVRAPRLELDPERIRDSAATFSLSNGMITILPIKQTLKSIGLEAELRAGDAVIQKLTGLLGGGSFSAKGAIKGIMSSQLADVDIELNDINMAKLLPVSAPGRPGFEGALSLTMSSSIKGLAGQNMLGTLAADGTVDLSRAVLKDMNILTLALDKLNMLPGLVAKLKEKLPENYKELLRQKDTVFKPMRLNFTIRDGRVLFKDARVESDVFYLMGSGYLGLNRDLAIHSNIFIPKDLSEAFIGAVRELTYLKNAQGMITMPVDIGGKLPGISVRPDLDYVIQKLAVSKGQELLESIFRKSEPDQPEQSSQAQGEGSDAQPPPDESGQQKKIKPEEAIIKTIFDIISSPKE